MAPVFSLSVLAISVAIRIWLSQSPVAEWLAEKNEVITPLTSWKRVTEGLSLHENGVSPYSGDIFHQMPLMLHTLNYLNRIFGNSIHHLFWILDIIIAVLLERISKHYSKYLLYHQAQNVKDYSSDAQKLLLKAEHLRPVGLYVMSIYLLNPYTIATCVAKSTAIFNNLAVALSVLFTLKGNRLAASLWVAIAAYISLYPIMLAVPSAMFIHRGSLGKPGWTPAIIQSLICTSMGLLALVYLSFMIQGSWDFIDSTYGFILSVPDLTPNIGVFWYFFTEMFEHFRLFFICVFQINAFIYTVPLAIKLKDHPLFMMYILIALTAIFKSYPSYGDAALYLSLLPLWKHVFPYMRNNFVVTCMFVVCSVLAPVLYYLWIYAGSANANFYFAITLVYSTAQIFLVTDILFAFLRREYDLIHGLKQPTLNGKPAQVILE